MSVSFFLMMNVELWIMNNFADEFAVVGGFEVEDVGAEGEGAKIQFDDSVPL